MVVVRLRGGWDGEAQMQGGGGWVGYSPLEGNYFPGHSIFLEYNAILNMPIDKSGLVSW